MTYHRTQYLDCDVQDCVSRYTAAGARAEGPADVREAARAEGWTSEHHMANAAMGRERHDICPLDHDA